MYNRQEKQQQIIEKQQQVLDKQQQIIEKLQSIDKQQQLKFMALCRAVGELQDTVRREIV
jgi:predicted DNA-binding protein with PD1-like motif